jgi:gluconate 5-dehydrogenase
MSPPNDREPTVQELFDLRNKVALVTGASGYLGSRIAQALAEAGATVVVSSRDEERAASAAAALPAAGQVKHHAIVLDHMDEGSLQQGFQEAIARAGQIDVLVNNGHDGIGSDWTNVTAEQFSRQMVNATGYFLLARLVREHVVQRKASASVIMLGSMYGMVASYPEAYKGVCAASPAAYHALKGGIIHLTRHLAAYWAKDGVRVNCLSPGPFPNPDKIPDALFRRLEPHCPMGRMGAAHELKGAVVFLAGDASSYMTGQNLVIDGGWTAW